LRPATCTILNCYTHANPTDTATEFKLPRSLPATLLESPNVLLIVVANASFDGRSDG
jgi:hypothetical protein